MAQAQRYDVGGVLLDRPFRIRRLGHFGFNNIDMEAARHFYIDLLGFRVSDVLDFARRAEPGQLDGLGQTYGWFTRYGTDHHAFVIFPKRVLDALRPDERPEVTVNQITWQVGSLREVTEASRWLAEEQVRIRRSGRDTPGSNWHTYPFDPDGHVNELYYGIEQIGWNGHSKPRAMYTRGFDKAPDLPQISERQEVVDAEKAGIDLLSGVRAEETMPEKYDVGGILLARPFKITGIGPVRLFVEDVEEALGFYRDHMGLTVTEEVVWKGHRCVFLRANTEHHVMALYPLALRAELGLSEHTTCMSFGARVNDHRQLRDAVAFLKQNGVTIRHLPGELFPGIAYSAFAIDPDGHAIQLYYEMEQIGWDGRPRPAELRPKVDGDWPETVEPTSDTFRGETFLGPWG